MNKKVSIKDIAREVGVSVALVSYVLNDKEKEARVGSEMAARIRKVAQDMNYQPNLIARSLKSGRSKTIGLIVADISNPFFSSIARVVEDEASINNYTVIFGSSDENAEKSQGLINALIERQVDGLIIAPAENTQQQIQALHKKGFPLVLIDRYFTEVDTNSVRINNFQAAHQAVEHLYKNGYRRMAMIAYKTDLPHMKQRKAGFLEAMKEMGLKPGPGNLFESSYEHISTDVKMIMQQLLDKKRNRPDSFVFATNSLAVNGLKEIIRRKLTVPDEIGIVSFDESEALDFFYSPITYINQSTARIGKEAVKILLSQLSNDENTSSDDISQIIIDAQLVVRESCGEQRKRELFP